MAVIARTLIIKTMADLMANHRANRAEVLRSISLRVIKRRLQNRSRESDVVDHRVIKRIHRLRGGDPFCTIRRSANLAQLVVMFEGGTGAHISKQLLARFLHVQTLEAAPCVRVADLRIELFKLFQRTLFRLVAHPLQRADAFAVCAHQILNQREHFAFRRRREMLPHILLPDFFPDERLRQRDTALPPVTLLSRPRQVRAVKIEVSLANFFRQHTRTRTQNGPRRPQLPIGQCFWAQHASQIGGE